MFKDGSDKAYRPVKWIPGLSPARTVWRPQRAAFGKCRFSNSFTTGIFLTSLDGPCFAWIIVKSDAKSPFKTTLVILLCKVCQWCISWYTDTRREGKREKKHGFRPMKVQSEGSWLDTDVARKDRSVDLANQIKDGSIDNRADRVRWR